MGKSILEGIEQMLKAGAKAAPKEAEAARVARGKAMFPVEAYHGTANDFPAFDLDKAGSRLGGEKERAVFVTRDPEKASKFSEVAAAHESAPNGATVMPLRVDPGKMYSSGLRYYNSDLMAQEIAKARTGGYDSIDFPMMKHNHKFDVESGQMAILNPANIRSRFAQFDPAKRDSSDLLAGIGAGALALPALNAPAEDGYGDGGLAKRTMQALRRSLAAPEIKRPRLPDTIDDALAELKKADPTIDPMWAEAVAKSRATGNEHGFYTSRPAPFPNTVYAGDKGSMPEQFTDDMLRWMGPAGDGRPALEMHTHPGQTAIPSIEDYAVHGAAAEGSFGNSVRGDAFPVLAGIESITPGREARYLTVADPNLKSRSSRNIILKQVHGALANAPELMDRLPISKELRDEIARISTDPDRVIQNYMQQSVPRTLGPISADRALARRGLGLSLYEAPDDLPLWYSAGQKGENRAPKDWIPALEPGSTQDVLKLSDEIIKDRLGYASGGLARYAGGGHMPPADVTPEDAADYIDALPYVPRSRRYMPPENDLTPPTAWEPVQRRSMADILSQGWETAKNIPHAVREMASEMYDRQKEGFATDPAGTLSKDVRGVSEAVLPVTSAYKLADGETPTLGDVGDDLLALTGWRAGRLLLGAGAKVLKRAAAVPIGAAGAMAMPSDAEAGPKLRAITEIAKEAAREAKPMASRLSPEEIARMAAEMPEGSLHKQLATALVPNQRTGSIDAPYTGLMPKASRAAELRDAVRVEMDPRYAAPTTTDIADLQGGNLLSLYGDRSRVGNLMGYAGRDLDAPVHLGGGHEYALGEGNGAWASNKGPISSIQKKVLASEDPVYGMYVPMSGEATDFAKMSTDALMQGFDPKAYTAKERAEFKRTLKNMPGGEYADFPGLDDKAKLKAWLDELGGHRYGFLKEMDKARWQGEGKPDVAAMRQAIQHPDLRGLPNGNEAYGGQMISRMDPRGGTRPTEALPLAHSTYPVDISGDYVGALETPVPRSLLFRDWYGGRRVAGAPVGSDNRAFSMSMPMQKVDQQLVDQVSKYIEDQRKLGDVRPLLRQYADGGQAAPTDTLARIEAMLA